MKPGQREAIEHNRKLAVRRRTRAAALPAFKTIGIEGMVFSFTKPQWLNYVLDGIAGTQRIPKEYGAKFVCGLDHGNVLDWSESEWIAARDEMMAP